MHDDGRAFAVVTAGSRLDLPGYSWSGPRPAHGQTVTLGVRPEHIRISDQGSFAGRVTLVEPMGNQQVAWIDWHGSAMASLSHGSREFETDETVRFEIDAGTVSLFDPVSEQRL